MVCGRQAGQARRRYRPLAPAGGVARRRPRREQAHKQPSHLFVLGGDERAGHRHQLQLRARHALRGTAVRGTRRAYVSRWPAGSGGCTRATGPTRCPARQVQPAASAQPGPPRQSAHAPWWRRGSGRAGRWPGTASPGAAQTRLTPPPARRPRCGAWRHPGGRRGPARTRRGQRGSQGLGAWPPRPPTARCGVRGQGAADGGRGQGQGL